MISFQVIFSQYRIIEKTITKKKKKRSKNLFGWRNKNWKVKINLLQNNLWKDKVEYMTTVYS